MQGLTSDSPSELAAAFIERHKLPGEYFEELESMVEMKIKDYVHGF